MPIVPRYFEPSLRGAQRKTREGKDRDPWAKMMISGGREGPEVGRKPLRTSRVTPETVEEGSPSWSEQLEEGRTPPEARTQPPFLRDTRLMDLAYRQGLMTVSDSLRVATDALKYAEAHPGYIPKVEYTSISIRGGLASASGRLIDADVDTLSQALSANWAAELAQLAADIRAAEAAVPRSPKKRATQYETAGDFVGRVYLNLANVSIPVEQFAVVESTRRDKTSDVYGVYSPGRTDGPVRFKGAELQPGTPIRLPVSAVQFVSFDPPEYRQQEFINSPAFARSRGILIEPEADVARRLGLKPGEPYIVPYSQILRLRMIYPPAKGYERKSSTTVESTASIERDLRAAQRRIDAVRDALVLKIRAAVGRRTKKTADGKIPAALLAYTDEATGLRFNLMDPTFEGTINPTVVWTDYEIETIGPNGRPETVRVAPAGDSALVGRPVTPVDFLRALRAIAGTEPMKALRKR